jgi:cell wall assembly regulator SMI1
MESVSGLADLLVDLSAELTRLNAPITRHWRPGADPDAVAEQLRSVGAAPHPDVVTWYSWHDGTDLPSSTTPPGHLLAGDGSCVFGLWHLLTLEQATVQGAYALELDAEWVAALGTGIYRSGWFPVLVALDGWLVCIDTSGQAAEPGSVFVWNPHAGDDPFALVPWFGSAAELVAAIVAAYRHGKVSPTQGFVELEELPDASRGLFY